MVYPGAGEIRVERSPGNTFCLSQSASDTSCTGEAARDDVLNITITQTSDIHPTVDNYTFDSKCHSHFVSAMLYKHVMYIARVLVMEEQILRLDTDTFKVVVRRNGLCPETDSPVLVTFGGRPVTGGDCEGQLNATEKIIPSRASASFYVNTTSISLRAGETYCFTVSLDGVAGELCKRKCDSISPNVV